MKKVVIFGANSAIAQEVARIYGSRGDHIHLVARNPQKLSAIANDLRTRGCAKVTDRIADLNNLSLHQELLSEAQKSLGQIDVLLIAYGSLGDQKTAQTDFSLTQDIIETNFLSPVSLLSHAANLMEQQKHGTLAAITSVAGDRGRGSNYVYGSAKGALSIFLAGLRNRLFGAGVRVVNLKLGFVDTPMTASFKKGPLWASPRKAAKGIVRAIDCGKPVAYVPGFWRAIMCVIRSIPERIFVRLKL